MSFPSSPYRYTGSDLFSKWRWPDVEGMSDYKGTLVHSANWPKDFDYANKTVAVIGNGASGVQIVPAMRPGKWSNLPS